MIVIVHLLQSSPHPTHPPTPTPKTKLLSKLLQLAELLNPLLHHPGCMPDNTWLPAKLRFFFHSLSFFSSTTHGMKTALLVLLIYFVLFNTRRARRFATSCWQLFCPPGKVGRFSFIYATAHLVYATWETDGRVEQQILLDGKLYVSPSNPCRRMHAERLPPPYQSMGIKSINS